MRSRLSRQVVVVTGASSGIGRATARAFAAAGATVVVTARRGDALQEVAEACRDDGAEVLAVPLDVTDAEAVDDLARRAVARFGRLDVWVNNAGVVLYGRTEEVPADLWRRVVETNVFGTYHGIRAVVPWLREQGSGVLVNVSSILGKAGSPYQSAYVASKHAVRALGDCVRQEVVDVDGIAVCTVLPGPVDTPLFRNGGNFTGRRVVPPGAPVEPRRVAAAIVRCAVKPEREVVVGSSTRLGLLANRIAPRPVEALTARKFGDVHFDEVPAPRTPGNLREPRTDTTTVCDGWRGEKVRRRRGALAAAGGVAALAAVAAGAARSREMSRTARVPRPPGRPRLLRPGAAGVHGRTAPPRRPTGAYLPGAVHTMSHDNPLELARVVKGVRRRTARVDAALLQDPRRSLHHRPTEPNRWLAPRSSSPRSTPPASWSWRRPPTCTVRPSRPSATRRR